MGEPRMANSKCRWQCPEDWAQWSQWLAAGLHVRNRWRLPVLLVGILFAHGRRTVTTWLRAAGVSPDFQDYYYFLAAVGSSKGVVRSDPGTDQAAGNAASISRPSICVARRKRSQIDELGEATLTYRPIPPSPSTELWQRVSRQTKMAAGHRKFAWALDAEGGALVTWMTKRAWIGSRLTANGKCQAETVELMELWRSSVSAGYLQGTFARAAFPGGRSARMVAMPRFGASGDGTDLLFEVALPGRLGRGGFPGLSAGVAGRLRLG